MRLTVNIMVTFEEKGTSGTNKCLTPIEVIHLTVES